MALMPLGTIILQADTSSQPRYHAKDINLRGKVIAQGKGNTFRKCMEDLIRDEEAGLKRLEKKSREAWRKLRNNPKALAALNRNALRRLKRLKNPKYKWIIEPAKPARLRKRYISSSH